MATFLPIPPSVATSSLNAAQSRGHLITFRSSAFEEYCHDNGLVLMDLLSVALNKKPGRFHLIKQGLSTGIYFTSVHRDEAFYISTLDTDPKDEELRDQVDFVISYSSEDLQTAMALRDTLRSKGTIVYMIDVRHDPTDSFWWLRYKTAMARGAYFLPILSQHYTTRQGSAVEAVEIMASLDAIVDARNWFPVLPMALPGWRESEGELMRLFERIPGIEINGDLDLKHYVEWALIVRGGNAAKLSMLLKQWKAMEKAKFLDDGDNDDWQIRVPIGDPVTLRLLVDGRFRLLAMKERIRSTLSELMPVEGERIRVDSHEENSSVNIRARHLRDEGMLSSALTLFAACVEYQNYDSAISIAFGETLEAMGDEGAAFVCFQHARDKMITQRNRTFSNANVIPLGDLGKVALNKEYREETREKVISAILRLRKHAPFYAGVTFGDVYSYWQRQRLPSVHMPEFPTELEHMAAELTQTEQRPHGIRDYFDEAAKAAVVEKDFLKAERVMARCAFLSNSSKQAFYMAARMAAEQGALDRTFTYLAFAFDIDPENEDIRQALKRAIEPIED